MTILLQMQNRANAEIVVYSGKIQKPGVQRYEAQKGSQESAESKKQKSSNRKTNRG